MQQRFRTYKEQFLTNPSYFMTKRIALTAFVMLFAALVAMAQTDSQRPGTETSPANKTEKVHKAQSGDKADHARHAEERSNGNAFSGKGKGGDKDKVEKNGKGHHKGKHKSKGKGKNKGNKAGTGENKEQRRSQTGEQNPQQPRSQRPEQPQTDKESLPAPKTRKPGDKPTPGTEQQKDQKSRG